MKSRLSDISHVYLPCVIGISNSTIQILITQTGNISDFLNNLTHTPDSSF